MTNPAVSEQALLILAALAAGPRHGYAVIADVHELSENRIRLRVGTLYGILDRLASQGTIEVDHEEVVDSRLRRYYRLTDSGHDLFARETERAHATARAAAARLAQARSAQTKPQTGLGAGGSAVTA